MPNLGTPELIIILLIALLLVGGKKLPELARSVGTSMKELRKGMESEKTKTKKSTTAKAKKES